MKSNRKFTRSLAHALIVTLSLDAFAARAADFVVIVNKANTASVDKDIVAKIYTGNMKLWGDGTAIVALDLPENDPIRANFCNEIIGKTIGNLKALWAQLVFSGKALPPKQMASDDEVKKFVSANKGGIGYIKQSGVDDSIKVALK